MNIKKIAIVALALCAASVACAAPSDEIFLSAEQSAATEENLPAEKISAPEELAQADESSRTELELPVIESSIPLVLAARDGDAEEIRELLASGAVVDAHGKNGVTALMAAALYSHDLALDELLAGGADVNAASRAGWTPLMYALFTGSETTVAEKLLEKGAQADAANAAGWTPLMFALRSGKPLDFIKKLINSGAYPETRANDGTTPMMLACANAADPQIVRFLYNCGAEIALPCKNGDTPLHFVAQNSTDAAAEIAEFLVKNRAPLWARNRTGDTPLMTVAEKSSHPDVVEAILAADWRVNAKNGSGMTALMLAAGNPTPAALEIAKHLAAAGASFATTDNWGRTAYLVGLCTAHSLEIVRWLKGSERGATEKTVNLQLAVQSVAKPVANASLLVISPKTEEAEEEEAETEGAEVEGAEDATPETENIEAPDGEVLNEEIPDGEAQDGEEPETDENEPRVRTLGYASKALEVQNAPTTTGEKGSGNPEIAPLANVSLASRHIATSSLRKVQIKKSETMRPFKKRRELKKLRVSRKKDPVLVPQLLLAAINPTEASPEIIAWLLEKGEILEARDTEGRTALICAVRYNSNPLAARALLEAGANSRVAFRKSSLLQLLRYNERMENDEKEALAKLIRAAKKK